MKKIKMTFLIIAILFISMTVNVYADDSNEYFIHEGDFKITIPDELIVFTRDMEEDAPALNKYGINKETAVEIMTLDDSYLQAISENGDYTISVNIIDAVEGIESFNDLEKLDLLQFGRGLFSTKDNAEQLELYQHNQIDFLKIYYTQNIESVTCYTLQYFTVNSGKAISIFLQKQNEKIGSDEERVLENVINGIIFENIPIDANKTSYGRTGEFRYEDSETGIEFTVPENWAEASVKDGRKIIKAKFISTPEEQGIILYGGTDLMSALSEQDKTIFSRSDVNNSFFQKSDIADVIKVPQENISMISCGEYEYYKAEMPFNIEECKIKGDGEIPNIMTVIVHIENGYLHMFQFFGYDGSRDYQDFEKLLNSIQYEKEMSEKIVLPQIGVPFNNASPLMMSKRKPPFFVRFLASCVVIGACYIIKSCINKMESKDSETKQPSLEKTETKYEMVILKEYGNDEKIYKCYLDKPIVVGKNSDECNLVIQGKGIERKHCRFFIKQNRCYVENLSVLNRTSVNQRIFSEPVPLKKGDILKLGDLELVVIKCPGEEPFYSQGGC